MNNRLDAINERKEICEHIDLLSHVCKVYVDLENGVFKLEESTNKSMLEKSVMVSKLLTSNRDGIELESIDEVLKDGNIDAEAINDKVFVSLDSIRNLFKSTRQKLFEATEKAKGVWVKDNDEKIKSLYSELNNRVNVNGIDSTTLNAMNKIMGDNLSTIKDSKVNIDDLLELAKAMTQSFNLGMTTNLDELAGGLIKRKDSKITGSDYIKVTRLDGRNLSFIVIGEEFGVRGIRYYDSIKLASNKSVLSTSDINIEYATKLLSIANEINNLLPNISDSIRTELAYVEDSIKDISNKAKWKTGKDGLTIGSLSMYVGCALLVAFGVYAGGVPIVANMVKQAGVMSMNILSTIVRGYMKLSPKPKAIIGAAAIFGGPAIVTDLLPKWFRKTSKEMDDSVDDEYYRMMEDKAKVKLLTARVEMTTRYSLDAMYGMYFLVLELMSTASIIIEHLDKKGEN